MSVLTGMSGYQRAFEYANRRTSSTGERHYILQAGNGRFIVKSETAVLAEEGASNDVVHVARLADQLDRYP